MSSLLRDGNRLTSRAEKGFSAQRVGGLGEGIPPVGEREGILVPAIGKWDVFYYMYGLLRHPGYREKYGDCLKRELPRIPFAADFWAFAEAGRKLAKWRLDYEKIKAYELRWEETEGKPLSYRVEDK